MAGRLQGRRVVLTGASRGIGLATARLFLEEGADLIGIGRDPEHLQQAAEQLRGVGEGRLRTVVADLEDEGSEQRVARAVEERWHGLDLLMNNAGVKLDTQAKGLFDEPPGTLERTLDINVLGPFRLTQALLPLLLQGNDPRIINVGSRAGSTAQIGEAGIASYRLSKWVLHGMTQLMATQLRGRVAVNTLDPGWVKTELGGAKAPGTSEQSAGAALKLALAPSVETGKLWKGGEEIPF